jgi:hypothetical protein
MEEGLDLREYLALLWIGLVDRPGRADRRAAAYYFSSRMDAIYRRLRRCWERGAMNAVHDIISVALSERLTTPIKYDCQRTSARRGDLAAGFELSCASCVE